MTERDPPRPQPNGAGGLPTNVLSIEDRLRRRERQRAVEQARRALADHTRASEAGARTAEFAAEIEDLELDGDEAELPEGADEEARQGWAQVHCARAIRCHLRGDVEGAEAELDLVRREAPELPIPYVTRGRHHETRGQFEEAIASYDRAAELSPNEPIPFFRRGDCYAALGDHERALANFRRALQLDPTSFDGHRSMGRSFAAHGDLRQAIGAYDRAIKLAPHYADFQAERGLLLAEAGEQEAAVRDFDRSLELNPLQPRIFLGRAMACQELGQHARAVADFIRVRELVPDLDISRTLGRARLLAGQLELAIADLTTAVERAPDDHFAYWQRAIAHQENKELRAAFDDFDRAATLEPTELVYVLGRAEMRRRLDGPEAVLVDLDLVLALKPTDVGLLVSRAQVRTREGALSDALRDYDRAITLSPFNADLYHRRADVHYKMEAPERALADQDQAVELEPDVGLHYGWRASYRFALGQEGARVEADFARALELAPTEPLILLQRAIYYEEKERYLDAIADLELAMTMTPEEGVLYYRRGVSRHQYACMMHEGVAPWTTREQEEETRLIRAAVADFHRCLELGPRVAVVYKELSHALSTLEDDAGAIEALDRALEAGPVMSDLHFYRYVARRSCGDHDGARADLAEALALGWGMPSDDLQQAQDYIANGPSAPELERQKAEAERQKAEAERQKAAVVAP